VSDRGRLAIAAVVAIGALTAAVVLAVRVFRPDDGSASFDLGRIRAAAAPFADSGFSETRVALDDDCLRVLLARSPSERSQGLRAVRDLGPYDGMLFVYSSDSASRYTMADTLVPLDIGWYAADGSLVDRTQMEPCPEGSDATCPTYGSDRAYRYALERPAGQLGSGSLGTCSA
jgi:uncharacterized membrane protein (UPF0127 family)